MANYIPEKIVILRKQVNADITQGLIVPDCGNIVKFNSRLKTARINIAYYSTNNMLSEMTSDNKPLTGYSVVDVNSKYSSSDVYWGVLSPDGYRIDISSKNFNHLLENTDIKRTIIQEPLVWIRCGQSNFLTTTETTEYKTALSIKQMNTSLPFSSVKVGNKISSKSFMDVIYCGVTYILDIAKLFNSSGSTPAKKQYSFLSCSNTDYDGIVYSRSTPVADIFSIDTNLYPHPTTPTHFNSWSIISDIQFNSKRVSIELKKCSNINSLHGVYKFVVKHANGLDYVLRDDTNSVSYFRDKNPNTLKDINGLDIPSFTHERTYSRLKKSDIIEIFEVEYKAIPKETKNG
jgi:hypothetical protein